MRHKLTFFIAIHGRLQWTGVHDGFRRRRLATAHRGRYYGAIAQVAAADEHILDAQQRTTGRCIEMQTITWDDVRNVTTVG